MLISEIDKFQEELKANGLYDCCVKPACRQCAITAGECHCRRVIDANGPCCGECTQSWVEGRGNTEGVDREQVLAHLGCVRELYEKKTPEGIALMVAGHSHGGQVNFPIYGPHPWVNDRRFMKGEAVVDGKHVFVTTGVGCTGPQIRFRVPPEIAVLSLNSTG